MALNERQRTEALEAAMNDAAAQGVDLAELDREFSAMKPTELDSLLDDYFVKSRPEIQKNAVEAVVQGGVDSLTFGLAQKGLAAVQAAVDPEEDYQQKLAKLEDEQQVARIQNPTSYTIGNIAGYFGGASSLVGKGAGAAIKGSGLASSVARGAATGVIEQGVRTGDAGQMAEGGLLGAAGGAVGQAVVGAAGQAALLPSRAKSAVAFISTKLHGKLDDEMQQLVDEAPSLVRAMKNGIGKANEKSKAFVAKLQEKLDEAAKRVQAFTPEEDAVIAGSDLKEAILGQLDEVSKLVKEKAGTAVGVAKKEMEAGIKTLVAAGQLSGDALTDNYRAKIQPIMAKIGGKSVDAGDVFTDFIGKMEDAGRVINGKLVDIAGDGKSVSVLNGGIETLRKNATFAKLNGFKTALGRSIDWSEDVDPAQLAMKDLYMGIRDKLSGVADESGVDVKQLFGEYQDGLKVISAFKKVFNTKSDKDPIGSLARLGTNLREEWGKGSQALFSPQTQQAVRHVLYQAKEVQSGLKIVNNQKLSKSLLDVVKGQDDGTRLAGLIEHVGARKQAADTLDQLPLADEVRSLFKDPFNGKLEQKAREAVKKWTPKASDAFEAALSKAKQLRSANKIPKQTRVTFDLLKATGLRQEWIDQFEGVAAMVPEFNDLLRQDRLEQLAKSPLLKETQIEQVINRFEGYGIVGAAVSGNPKALQMALGAAVLKFAMQNPAKLAIAAEKSKAFGTGRQLETLIQKVTTLNNVVFPAVYGTMQQAGTKDAMMDEMQSFQQQE